MHEIIIGMGIAILIILVLLSGVVNVSVNRHDVADSIRAVTPNVTVNMDYCKVCNEVCTKQTKVN